MNNNNFKLLETLKDSLDDKEHEELEIPLVEEDIKASSPKLAPPSQESREEMKDVESKLIDLLEEEEEENPKEEEEEENLEEWDLEKEEENLGIQKEEENANSDEAEDSDT